MQISNLEFTWSETRQPKPYESCTASLKVVVCLEEGDDKKKVTETIMALTKEKVKRSLAEELNAKGL